MGLAHTDDIKEQRGGGRRDPPPPSNPSIKPTTLPEPTAARMELLSTIGS